MKDATWQKCYELMHEVVSIHASVKDATKDMDNVVEEAMFQSTRP